MSSEADKPEEYRVLARKYRPSSFDDLIGQEPMVRTLRNAFASDRIAQAYMLTGVRGVGKTTTARILARALNYETNTIKQPTLDFSEPGIHCEQIMAGRHVDVIEMDAASNRGIDDAREINSSIRYKPSTARFKVYILDEVHMLTKEAFNALLKTLEEPPAHVKFIFATTEIRKVPVTVLSRCQRFDLRRIEPGMLKDHLAKVAKAENVEADDEALAMIARAGEGSVRDALSLLDQAISHASGKVEAKGVRDMLGLADRARVVDLFEHVMKGDIAAALTELKEQYDTGAEPAAVLTDLAAFVHLVTRMRYAPGAADDPVLTPEERTRGPEFAKTLSPRVLGRAWQMLLKGIAEVQSAPSPLPAADMVLVRLTHAADLPTPEEALKALADTPSGGGGGGGRAISAGGPSSSQTSAAINAAPNGGATMKQVSNGPSLIIDNGEPAYTPHEIALEGPAPEPEPAPPVLKAVHDEVGSFDDLLALAESKRDIRFKLNLRNHVSLVALHAPSETAVGRFEYAPVGSAPSGLRHEIAERLNQWTGQRWEVIVLDTGGQGSLKELQDAERSALFAQAEADPVVAAVLQAFPKSRIIDVRTPEGEDDGLDAADVLDAGLANPDADNSDEDTDTPPPGGLDDYF